jgi:hypothetical protein
VLFSWAGLTRFAGDVCQKYLWSIQHVRIHLVHLVHLVNLGLAVPEPIAPGPFFEPDAAGRPKPTISGSNP